MSASTKIRSFAAFSVVMGLAGVVAIPMDASAQGKTVYLQKNTDARSFDPHKLISRTVGEILPFILDTLVTIEDDLATIRDGLAREWTVSPDGMTYVFTLKDNLRFCDGKPLTARNVETTFKRWRDPATKSINTVLLGPLDSVTALDDKTVQFKLREPYAEFLSQLTSPYAGIIDADEAASLGDKFAVTSINGSGPYCWGNWRPREEFVLNKNPHYTWGGGVYKNKGPAQVESVVFKIMPEDNSRVAALRSGQSDASYYIPGTAIAQFRGDPNFEIVQPRAFGWVAFIGTKIHRPLMEPAVRRAMNFAIDREAIVDALYAGEADPAPFVLSPKFEGYNKAIESKLPRYDVKLANKILDDAGWKLGADRFRYKDGVKLAPVLVGYNAWRERLEAVQGMMRDVGIELKLELSDTPLAVGRILGKDDFDMFGYFGSYANVGEVLQKYFLASEPVSPYRYVPELGKQIDQLISAGRREPDKAKRNELYASAQELIAEQHLWVPLTHERMLVVYNKSKVSGVKAHGLAGNGLYKGLDFAPAK